MPKLNATHLPERIREVIKQLERGEEVEAKKNETLLNDEQRKALDDAWAIQQVLRKTHKPPKTEEEKQQLGWKDKREVRIEIYKQALTELDKNVVNNIRELQRQREAKANRVYMDAWSKAIKEGKRGASAQSVGNIALTRAGFSPSHSVGLSKRDREIRDMEDALLKQFEAKASQAEKEQLAILKEHEKALEKRKK
jgi:hypothetical protein